MFMFDTKNGLNAISNLGSIRDIDYYQKNLQASRQPKTNIDNINKFESST